MTIRDILWLLVNFWIVAATIGLLFNLLNLDDLRRAERRRRRKQQNGVRQTVLSNDTRRELLRLSVLLVVLAISIAVRPVVPISPERLIVLIPYVLFTWIPLEKMLNSLMDYRDRRVLLALVDYELERAGHLAPRPWRRRFLSSPWRKQEKKKEDDHAVD